MLQVRVSHADGTPIGGMVVQWAVSSGSGDIRTQNTTTNGAGISSALWTLGTDAGAQTASAVLSGAGSVTFVASAAPGAPSIVVVNPSSVTLSEIGDEQSLSVLVSDAFGNPIASPAAIWSSLNPAIVQVDPTGLVRAISEGDGVVRVQVGEVTTDVTVSVGSDDGGSGGPTPVPAVVIVGASSDEVEVGGSVTAIASVRDSSGELIANAEVAWSSEPAGVVSVDANGEVTGVSVGTALIRATSGGVSGTVSIDVVEEGDGGDGGASVPAAVEIVPTGISMEVGSEFTFSAVVKNAEGAVLPDVSPIWSSDDSAVAAVDGSGVVSGIAEGTTTVRASVGAIEGTASVQVTDPDGGGGDDPVPATVEIEPTSASLDIGTSFAFSVQVKDADGVVLTGVTVIWSSDDPGVASVDGSGTVSAVAEGETTIRAVAGAAVGTATVQITDPDSDGGGDPVPATVAIVPESLELVPGGTASMQATVRDGEGTVIGGSEVTWNSDDPSVATVDAAGTVTAESAGATTIRALAGGVEGTASVTVSDPVPTTLEIDTEVVVVLKGESMQLGITVKDQFGNPISDPLLELTSHDPEVAVISTEGLITGIDGGATTVDVRVGTLAASLAVIVTDPDDYHPMDDDEIDGDLPVDDVIIPVGVTVTVTGDLDLDAGGSVEIHGTLIGDCVEIAITADESVLVTGEISNVCVTDPNSNGPPITVHAGTELELIGAEVYSSGDVELQNDPLLSDIDFIAATPPSGPVEACRIFGSILSHIPMVAPTSPSGHGRDGKSWTLRCSGGLTVGGWAEGGALPTSITTQHGGVANANSGSGGLVGFDGGRGGDVRLQSTGLLSFSADGGSSIAVGDGGPGGDVDVGAGIPATGLGGDGGDGGAWTVAGLDGISFAANGPTVDVGSGGAAGSAITTGTSGAAGTGSDGGSAVATGGLGGSAAAVSVNAGTGATGTAALVLAGGHGGLGGDAFATGGVGGSGGGVDRTGGAGGDMEANGGGGGDGVPEFLGRTIGSAGSGGSIGFAGGAGGAGISLCSPVQGYDVGGDGGVGGSVTGGPGAPGASPGSAGSWGSITVSDGTGNGGNGGGGTEFGSGGAAGSQTVDDSESTVQVSGTAFQPGTDGGDCEVTLDAVIEASLGALALEISLGLESVSTLRVGFVSDVAVTLTGEGAWPDLEGAIDAGGNLTLELDGAVPGVLDALGILGVSFDGTFDRVTGALNGTLSIELVNAVPILPPVTVTYSVSATAQS